MAAILLPSIGSAIVGTVIAGWLNQNKSSSKEKWDPHKYVIQPNDPVLLTSTEAEKKNISNKKENSKEHAKKEKQKNNKKGKKAVTLNETKSDPKMSEEGMAALSMLTTKFGGIQLNPQNTTISFRRREMEEPDQSRLNEFALQDLKDMEFTVGIDETYECPLKNMISISHQEPTIVIGANTTPQMERVLREKSMNNEKNISKLKALNGCNVNIKRVGRYVLTDHLSPDGVLSADGKTLVLNKGLTLGKTVVSLQSGDKIVFNPTSQTSGGEFSMYRCQQGTSMPNKSSDEKYDSYESCMSERIRDFDTKLEEQKAKNLFLDSTGRKRWGQSLQRTFQKIDDVQPPPNMERPDVYCDDVARIVRDGYNQKNTVRSYKGMGARNSIALAADSHFGNVSKVTNHRRYDTVLAMGKNNLRGPTADPIRSQENIQHMKQADGDIATNRPRGYEDKSGLRGYIDDYDRTHEPRETDHRFVNDVPNLTPSQILNENKRGGGYKQYKDFSPARKARVRGDKTLRQASGYMEGGMIIHEVDTGGRKYNNNNIRRHEKPYQKIYKAQHEAGKDDAMIVETNLRLHDVSKPVVKLRQLEHIPGVMHRRGVQTLGDDVYDASRPHRVSTRPNFEKDAASTRGVRNDDGRYLNQFSTDNNPHQFNYQTNAIDLRGKSDLIEFGRQLGPKANDTFNGENRQQQYDFKFEEEPYIAKTKMRSRKTFDSQEQRSNIHDYKQPGAEATRDTTYEERIPNEQNTTFMTRILDAEKPVTRYRSDDGVEGKGKTAKTNKIYSNHEERSVQNLNEGVSSNRTKTYEAGIKTATGKLATVEQQTNLFQTSNATTNDFRRDWTGHFPGKIVGMGESGYSIDLDNGKTIKNVLAVNLRKRVRLLFKAGDRVKNMNVTITSVNKNGSYNIQKDDGEEQAEVILETIEDSGVYMSGDRVEVRTANDTSIDNQTILNVSPDRYDGIIRHQKAIDGKSLAMPRNAERGSEWYRDDDLKTSIDTAMMKKTLNEQTYVDQNQEFTQNEKNAVLTSGFATEKVATGEVEEDPKNWINLKAKMQPFTDQTVVEENHPQPPDNLTHRPSYEFHQT